MAILDRLALALGRAASWCFAAVAVVMVWEVVARYAFHAPTTWSQEVSIGLAAVGFVLGGAFCMAEGTHMRIDLLVAGRPRFAAASHWLGAVAGTVYLGGLAIAAWRMADRALWRFAADGSWDPERSGSTLNSPLPGILKATLLVGSVLFLVVLWGKLLPRRRA